MTAFPREAFQAQLGCELKKLQAIPGGDICQAFQAKLSDGRTLFVKTRVDAPSEMFPSEGKGLRWLAETEALRIPQVQAAEPSFLALEFLASAARKPDFDQLLGWGLAELHRYPAGPPGWFRDNFIGPLPQDNTPCSNWAEFYVQKRLQPRLLEALHSGRAPQSWEKRFEKLFRELPKLIPNEPLSRLHGDLWGGNLHVGPEGEPCLIDPSVYVGHREMDLAMMRLFGGFSSAVFQAYEEAYPLQAGAEKRIPLYQLYPLLVHVNLFGSGYLSSVESALQSLQF